MAAVVDRAVADALALAAGPVDAILVENFGDSPFYPGSVPAETVAGMTAALAHVRQATDLPMGVNVLRNDPAAALAVVETTGCAFIRVNVHTGGMFTDQGWIEGDAAATLRLRQRLCPDVAILADVLVKHATPPPGSALERAAADAWDRGWADALIVSGPATGAPTDPEHIAAIRRTVPDAPVLVGSGITAETVAAALAVADGVIVGSALEEGGVAGAPVAPDRVRRLLAAAGR
jgi:uncharacterized protein